MKRYLVLGLVLTCLLAACRPSPFPTAEHTPTMQATWPSTWTPMPTATPTPVLPTATPRATRTPTAIPAPTSTPTPNTRWIHWPAVQDLRDIAIDADGSLWLASLNGLLHYKPDHDNWQVWTTANGLIDNACLSVALWQGAVWVSTPGGIGRFDLTSGSWQSYGTAEGLPGLYNLRLAVDKTDKALWAGGDGGLAVYDKDLDHWREESIAGKSYRVSHLWADADALWVSVPPDAENPGGLFWRDHKSGTWQDMHDLYPDLPRDNYALTATDEYMWVVGAAGDLPLEYNRETETWRKMEELARPTPAYHHPTTVEGTLWLWDSTTLVRYDPQKQNIRRTRPLGIELAPQGAIRPDGEVAWVPTRRGLVAMDTETWRREVHNPDSLPQVRTVLGHTDTILIVHETTGISQLDPMSGKMWPMALPMEPLPASQFFVAQDADSAELWLLIVPTDKNDFAQLWHYANALDVPQLVRLFEKLRPQRMLPQKKMGRLWFVMEHSLASFDLSNQAWQALAPPYPAEITAVALGEDAVWMIREGGSLARFDLYTGKWTLRLIPYGRDWSHLTVNGDTVWLAGDGDKWLTWNGKRWHSGVFSPTCTGGAITALTAGPDAIWAAGISGTVRHALATQDEQCFSSETGMLSNAVEQIMPGTTWTWFAHPQHGVWGYGAIKGKRP